MTSGRKKNRTGVPSYQRTGTRNLLSLLPGMDTETPDTLAEAFVGRFMRANDGEAYDLLAQPYCEKTGGYDLMNRSIENMYKRYVIREEWTEREFFLALGWILTNKMPIDSFSFGKAARLAACSRLPLGDLQYLSISTFNEIVREA